MLFSWRTIIKINIVPGSTAVNNTDLTGYYIKSGYKKRAWTNVLKNINLQRHHYFTALHRAFDFPYLWNKYISY